MRNIALIAFLAALIQGCATFEQPIPVGYTGPTATISEHGFTEDGMKGQVFCVEEINGKRVRSSIDATRKSNYGRGLSLTLDHAMHTVPAQPMKLKLIGTHITGAPIHELASRAAGTFLSVEGEIEFTPEPNGEYYVTGKLQKDGSSVWVADAKTEQPVTEVVTSKK